MGRPLKVTYEQVATAAEKMVSENLIPTKRKVRDILNVGSMNTISDFFDKWEDQKEGRIQSIDVLLSPTIAHAISDTIAQRVRETSSVMAMQIANLEEELNSLVVEHIAYEADLESQKIENTELIEKNLILKGRVGQLDEEAARIKTELIAERNAMQLLHITIAKSEQLLESLPGIKAQLENSRSELFENRTHAAKLHESAAVASAKLEAEVTQRKNSEAQLVEAVRQREDAEKRAFAVSEIMNKERVTVQAFQLRIDASVREIAAANDDAKNARAEAKKASEEAAEMRGKLASMKTIK